MYWSKFKKIGVNMQIYGKKNMTEVETDKYLGFKNQN